MFLKQGPATELEFQMRMQWKSVLIAWARLLIILAFAVSAAFAVAEIMSLRSDPFVSIAWACAFLTLLMCSYRKKGLGRATFERAVAL